MRVAIRADASPAIGSGHLMRCLCLADVLRAGGASVCFVCRELPGLTAQVLSRGYQTVALPEGATPQRMRRSTPRRLWPFAGAATGLSSTTTGSAQSGRPRVRCAEGRLLVIDDLARRTCATCCSTRTFIRSPTSLCEPARCPTTHAAARTRIRVAATRVRTGAHAGRAPGRRRPPPACVSRRNGRQQCHRAGIAGHRSRQAHRPAVDVVIGATHPPCGHSGVVRRTTARDATFRPRIWRPCWPDADLAVGAGGSATWERCVLGVPTLAWPGRQSARPACHGSRHGFLYAPDGREPDDDALATHLRALLANTGLRHHLSRRAFETVDGEARNG